MNGEGGGVDDSLIYLLGYLTAEQWADALSMEDLDRREIEDYLKMVDEMYSGIQKSVNELIKDNVVERLTR